MAPTSAVFSREHQKVIDDINDQFQLPNESLISITKAFLDEYSKGLSAYGHPMAMMCVTVAYWRCYNLRLKTLQTHFRYWNPRWYGERVSDL